jgi:hypothetical protein
LIVKRFPNVVFRPGAFQAIALLTAVSAIVTVLRILQRGELWLDRTYWVVALSALATAVSGAASLVVLRLSNRWRLSGASSALLSALTFAAIFLLALGVTHILYSFLLTDRLADRHERPLLSHVIMTGEAFAFYLLSSIIYALPWPLPVLMSVAAWLLPQSITKPVEDPRRGV